MRQITRRESTLCAVCMAVLDIIVLVHVGICVVAHSPPAHHHGPGTKRAAAASCTMTVGLRDAAGAAAFRGDASCP
ncbi:hypothetical protein [Streptosporangium sp. NPDC000396]|uniref:hypothetical protein n=1 Tax=Streptosporangium sp. NPDC000396 TaxID=3366185 RepID=UPI00368C42F1